MTTTITTGTPRRPRGTAPLSEGGVRRAARSTWTAHAPVTLAGAGGLPPRSPARAARAADDQPRDPGTRSSEDSAAPITPGTERIRAELADDTGATTAEYAITTLAACGFAAVLVLLLKSGEVRSLLLGIITNALSLGS